MKSDLQNKITESLGKEFINFKNNQNYERINFDKLPKELVESLVKEIYLENEFIKEAKKSNIAKNKEVKLEIEKETNKIIKDAFIKNTIKNEANEQKTNQKYLDLSRKFEGKKEALSLGIEKAKYDWVLLTDSDCRPQSDYWILSMMNAQNNQNNDVVLGIGYYEQKNSLLNKIIQYDTLLIAIQYLSFAKINQAYMGVGRNIAYKKSVFN